MWPEDLAVLGRLHLTLSIICNYYIIPIIMKEETIDTIDNTPALSLLLLYHSHLQLLSNTYPSRPLWSGILWRDPGWEPAFGRLRAHRWLPGELLEGHAPPGDGAHQPPGAAAGREHAACQPCDPYASEEGRLMLAHRLTLWLWLKIRLWLKMTIWLK